MPTKRYQFVFPKTLSVGNGFKKTQSYHYHFALSPIFQRSSMEQTFGEIRQHQLGSERGCRYDQLLSNFITKKPLPSSLPPFLAKKVLVGCNLRISIGTPPILGKARIAGYRVCLEESAVPSKVIEENLVDYPFQTFSNNLTGS